MEASLATLPFFQSAERVGEKKSKPGVILFLDKACVPDDHAGWFAKTPAPFPSHPKSSNVVFALRAAKRQKLCHASALREAGLRSHGLTVVTKHLQIKNQSVGHLCIFSVLHRNSISIHPRSRYHSSTVASNLFIVSALLFVCHCSFGPSNLRG